MQEIYMGDRGEGFPFILVHGFLGSSLMWEPQINFFKNHFRVITPDLPGFGKSNKTKPHNNIQSIANLLSTCIKEKNIRLSKTFFATSSSPKIALKVISKFQ